MTKIDIISGFLGAGKTTLIKKLIEEVFTGEKLVLIENEFGEIGIDGGFLKEAGVQITEMNSGCICCSLVGDFGTALQEVIDKFSPDRILIEPSGVGKLSDVIKAVQDIQEKNESILLNSFVTVADVSKCKIYMKNFGEFYNNQIEHASTIILSRTQKTTQEKIEAAVKLLREQNKNASIITTPWEELKGEQIFAAMEKKESWIEELLSEQREQRKECDHDHHHDGEKECGCSHHHHQDEEEECGCGHHHHEEGEECGCGHHHEEGEECEHGHHHQDEEEECGHGHHHNNGEEECGCGHHHHHGEECGCGHHHHHEEGHHHADDIFTSWGVETAHKYTEQELKEALEIFANTEKYGSILRAKGILPNINGEWMYFDLVPGEFEIRTGNPDYTGRLCVIGTDLKTEEIEKLFHIL